MNYKSVKKIHENFELDPNFEPVLAVRDPSTNEVVRRVPITNAMEKGYIYASLYFYDEVAKEVEKLHKMIRKILDELNQEVKIENPTLLLMELSNRVKQAIGDDSLDALIKEMLAEHTRAIALIPDDGEMKKLMVIKEAVYAELFQNFVNMTFKNATDIGELKTFTFAPKYVTSMTERQQRLLAPALRMAGFINQIRMDAFELLPNWQVRYKPTPTGGSFDAKEDEIKNGLKRLMEEHFNSV